jgi:hypothetical protein
MKNRHSYSLEEIEFLKSQIKGRSYTEVHKLFNERFGLALSLYQIKYKIQEAGLRTRKLLHKYTPEEKQFIEDNIPGRSYAELRHMFNQKFNLSITEKQMKSFFD